MRGPVCVTDWDNAPRESELGPQRSELLEQSPRDEVGKQETGALPRGLAILEALVNAARPLTSGEVVELVGLHPSRSEEHTSELQSLMRTSYAAFCLNTKNIQTRH